MTTSTKRDLSVLELQSPAFASVLKTCRSCRRFIDPDQALTEIQLSHAYMELAKGYFLMVLERRPELNCQSDWDAKQFRFCARDEIRRGSDEARVEKALRRKHRERTEKEFKTVKQALKAIKKTETTMTNWVAELELRAAARGEYDAEDCVCVNVDADVIEAVVDTTMMEDQNQIDLKVFFEQLERQFRSNEEVEIFLDYAIFKHELGASSEEMYEALAKDRALTITQVRYRVERGRQIVRRCLDGVR